MPQTDEELRQRWRHYAEGGGDALAIKALEDAGYALRGDWRWALPDPAHAPTDHETSAIRYLVEEWDFGGIIPPNTEPRRQRAEDQADATSEGRAQPACCA